MLSGQLIRSGNLRDVTPLGGVGYPVYAAAAQIRTAVAKELGQDYADFLAIPQFDSRGETIDWYAAIEGDVVPWEAASDSERNFMRQRIGDICARIEGHARQIQTAPKSSDQLVFGKLLELCTRIPDDSHIYLIGGKPLVTFWGFVRAGADTATHVLANLPAAPASALLQSASAAESAVSVAPARRRSWWWLLWLLLLLLLALSLFGLRSCTTLPVLPGFLQGIVHPDEPTQATTGPDGQVIKNGTVVGPGGGTVIPGTGTGAAVVPGTDGDTVNGTKAVTPDQTMPDQNVQDQNSPGQNETDQNAQKPEESGQGQKTPTDAGKTPDADNKDASQPQDQNKPDAGAQSPQQQQPANQQAGDENNSAQEASSIKPIAIPDDASSKGDPSFMDGDWRSKTGLVAKNAKGPVTIDYKFDRAGKGTTTLHLQNGVTCSGPSQASTSKGKVTVQDQGALSCSNGQSFAGAKVECTKDASGQSQCIGHYPNGQTFDIILGR